MTRIVATAVLVALASTVAPAQTGQTIYTATAANVAEPGAAVKIHIQRWSEAKDAAPLIAALTPAAGGGARGDAARAGGPAAGDGAGSADSGRGTPPAGRAAAAGRGRGRGRGAAIVAPLTPAQALAQALKRAPTIGYVWTGVVGYSIKYATRVPLPTGGERVILATDRQLGTNSAAWQPNVPIASGDDEFTIIEIRFDAKGVGEGKTSLTSKVVVDDSIGTVALDNYAAAAAILRNVKRS